MTQLQNEKKKEKQSQLKKKEEPKKYLRKIQADYLPRKQKYETCNRFFQERNSFSKTDTVAGYGSEENYMYIKMSCKKFH